MSRKRDPIIDVMRFFDTADLALAESTLELAKDKIRRRRGTTSKAGIPAHKAKKGNSKAPAETVAEV